MKKWFSTGELAALKLPGLPGTVRGIDRRAERENWKAARANGKPLCRKRKGRGGGVEYHYTVLPLGAQRIIEDIMTGATAARAKRWRLNLPGWTFTITAVRRRP